MHVTPEQRPEIAIGHLKLLADDVPATVAFFVELGIRPIVTRDNFAVLELRGGTHLVVRKGEGPVDPETRVPFDVMVDDIDDAAERYRGRGLEVGAISRGRIHDSFDLRTPDGRRLEVNSSHAGTRIV